MKYFIFYLLIINLISFITMFIDKRKAIKNRWRISEKTLFLQAIFGGAIGSLLGMNLFRHKTKHKKFVFGFWIILVLQILIINYWRT